MPHRLALFNREKFISFLFNGGKFISATECQWKSGITQNQLWSAFCHSMHFIGELAVYPGFRVSLVVVAYELTDKYGSTRSGTGTKLLMATVRQSFVATAVQTSSVEQKQSLFETESCGLTLPPLVSVISSKESVLVVNDFCLLFESVFVFGQKPSAAQVEAYKQCVYNKKINPEAWGILGLF
eukprot:gene22527-30790_t